MKIQSTFLTPFSFQLKNGQKRFSAYIQLVNSKGQKGIGEIAPLPNWSDETLDDCLAQIQEKESALLALEWTEDNMLSQLAHLQFLPAAAFGIESALFSLLDPLPSFTVPASALLMGSTQEILQQASLRLKEGFTSTKLKVGNLAFAEAECLIHQLKDLFHLRVDVNRAWETAESLEFFSQFPLETFDYVEEPFKNPHDLAYFPHPLAVDESFPSCLTFKELESFPTLKALIYKPTIQGGLFRALPLYEWAKNRKVDFILSSSFESGLGLSTIASLAQRLSLEAPIGIGTYHYLPESLENEPFFFERGRFIISD